MSRQSMMVNAVDPDGRPLFRMGGISAIVFAIAYSPSLHSMFRWELGRVAPRRGSDISLEI